MGWRSRLIFALIVYFAGFATAIYTLGPTPENLHAKDAKFPDTATKSNDFALEFNEYIHRYLQQGKEAAQRAGEYIKQKIAEKQTQS